MKKVYTHENSILVGNAKALLQQNGVEAHLKNEFASGAVGELSTLDSWPEIWVTDADERVAKEVIARLTDVNPQPDWQCSKCNESNDAAFEVCWHCQTPAVSGDE